MQKTNFNKFIESFVRITQPILSNSWRNRSFLLLSLLFGFYFTNSLLSFLLDRPVNTIFLAVVILFIMELLIRSYLISSFSKFSIILQSLNNFRIGSTYALILEAYKLGS